MNDMVIPGFIVALFAGVCAGGAAAPIKLMKHLRFEHWAFIAALTGQVLLPWLVMLLFWPRTTKQGITAAVSVGMVSSLTWILLSADTFEKVYGWSREASIVPFSQPGLVTIPLGFVVLIVVSFLSPRPTQRTG